MSNASYTQARERKVIQSHRGKGPHGNKYQSLMLVDQVPTGEIVKLPML